MEEIVIKAIIHKELSPQEREQLDNWLKDSQKNRMIYNQLKLTMKYPGVDRIREMKTAGLTRLKREISSNGSQSINFNRENIWTSRILKVAATIILFISVSLVVYMYQEDSSQPAEQATGRLIEKTSLPGQKITITLSDGTVVKLNADSKIIVPDYFAQDRRQVELIGEAYFDVSKDPSRPFIIKTNELEVEVLGTSFNLKAYPSESYPTVAVNSGKVVVNKTSGNEKIYLEPNEMVSISDNGSLSKRTIANRDLVFGWTEQRLVFEETSLEEVFEQTGRWFGMEIVVETRVINKRPYTASYNNPTIEEVFKSLSHLYQFDYEKNAKSIIIK